MEYDSERLTLEEVAQTLETTPLNVLMHIKRGFLDGSEDEDGWSVPRGSLQGFLDRTGGQKAQVVCKTGCGKAGGCGSGCS